MRFEHLADAGDGAARADAGDEGIEPALGRGEDLQRGAAPVGLWVGEVLKLLRHEAARVALDDLERPVDGALHQLAPWRQHDLRSVMLQEASSLGRGVVGHGDDQPVALDRRDQRQADAGVAAGRFDDGVSRLQRAALFGRLDHRQSDAVLDAAGGVEGLELDQHLGVLVSRQSSQSHHRRRADELEHIIGDRRSIAAGACGHQRLSKRSVGSRL